MKPWFSKNDEAMFYKYLKKCNNYFEFGSGGSTFQAANSSNIVKIFSVESDRSWHDKLKSVLKDKSNIQYLYNEMDTKPNTLGNPGPSATTEQKKAYSDKIYSISDQIDLILIDGRFRVACCLKCYNEINDDCVILFDDFLHRKHYHVVLDYYKIVEKTSDNIMVVLRKKPGLKIPACLIKKYEQNRD